MHASLFVLSGLLFCIRQFVRLCLVERNRIHSRKSDADDRREYDQIEDNCHLVSEDRRDYHEY